MTQKFPTKGTLESVVLGFDFSREASAVEVPTFTVACEPGVATDDDPAAILSGAPTIDTANPALVLQRVRAGLDMVDYRIQCTATAGDDTLTIAAILPVRLNL